MSNNREDRVQQLIALCIKNDVTPNKNTYAGFIQKMSSSRFGVSTRTAQDYATTISQAWKLDHWKSMIKENCYMTQETKNQWTQNH